MIEWLQQSVDSAGPGLQGLFLMLAGAIPFIESYFGTAVGVVAGIPLYVALPFAVVGNIVSMVVLVLGAHKIRAFFRRGRTEDAPSKRREKFFRLFEKYGVAGVSLLGQTVLPSQITSSMMAAAGVSKGRIIVWQSISIVLWGALFGGLALAGVNLVGIA